MECFRKVCALLKVTNLGKEKLPCIPGELPELDPSPILSEAQHYIYKQLVGTEKWIFQIRRFDISYALTSLNRFSATPMEGHISRMVNIFGYLKRVYGRRKGIVVSPEDIEEISGKGANFKDWLENYPGASDDIDEGLSEPRGRPISTSVYFDSNCANDQVTCRSVSGILFFVGSTLIRWTIKRQGNIKSSSYPTEFCASQVATEEAIALQYMLRYLGVPVRGAKELCGDNLVMITSFTNPDSDLKQKCGDLLPQVAGKCSGRYC